MTDIDFFTLDDWAKGVDPIDSAVKSLAVLISVRDSIAEERVTNPNAFSRWVWPDTLPETLARKVVGDMLDAGWTPPDAHAVAVDLRKSAERDENATDDDILRPFRRDGSEPPPGYVAAARRDRAESTEQYRRRADELEQAP